MFQTRFPASLLTPPFHSVAEDLSSPDMPAGHFVDTKVAEHPPLLIVVQPASLPPSIFLFGEHSFPRLATSHFQEWTRRASSRMDVDSLAIAITSLSS